MQCQLVKLSSAGCSVSFSAGASTAEPLRLATADQAHCRRPLSHLLMVQTLQLAQILTAAALLQMPARVKADTCLCAHACIRARHNAHLDTRTCAHANAPTGCLQKFSSSCLFHRLASLQSSDSLSDQHERVAYSTCTSSKPCKAVPQSARSRCQLLVFSG